MSIVDFENVKVTTMTVVIDIIGNVNIEYVFPLLPITRMNLKDFSKSGKKFKIPWPGEQYAGCIFSTKFAGITRGIIKTSKGKSFRNSVGIDICTSVKNISAKLSKNKIHMCGPNSEKLAVETGQHIINHLVNIQNELDYISEHIEERDKVISWLIKETKGDKFIINEETQEIIELKPGEKIEKSLVYDRHGKVKYIYKEIPFNWEEGDSINPENIIVNKYGQPYYRSLTKREKRFNLQTYPIMRVDDTLRIEEDRTPVDEKGNKFNKVSRSPLKVMEVTSVKYPDIVLKSLEKGKIVYPKNIDSRIANFLISYIQDYAYHHVLADFLENFKNIDRVFTYEEVSEEEEVYTEKHFDNLEDKVKYLEEKVNKPFQKKNAKLLPLTLGNMSIAMINYSYSIQMNVDRWKLTELIDGYEKDGKTWRAVFNNTTDHHVTITVPYTADEGENIKRKKSRAISWMVYKSGIVTQSGPSPALMKDVYYDFMNFINSVRDEIKLKDDKPFNIKYKPT